MENLNKVEDTQSADRLLVIDVFHELKNEELDLVSGGRWVPNPTNNVACYMNDSIWVY